MSEAWHDGARMLAGTDHRLWAAKLSELGIDSETIDGQFRATWQRGDSSGVYMPAEGDIVHWEGDRLVVVARSDNNRRYYWPPSLLNGHDWDLAGYFSFELCDGCGHPKEDHDYSQCLFRACDCVVSHGGEQV